MIQKPHIDTIFIDSSHKAINVAFGIYHLTYNTISLRRSVEEFEIEVDTEDPKYFVLYIQKS